MFVREFLRKTSFVIAGIVILGLLVGGTAVANHGNHIGNHTNEGRLTVLDDNLVVTRSDGGTTAVSLQNDGAANSFRFVDIDNFQTYRITLSADGEHFSFVDQTQNRNDIIVKTDTGHIGIGTTNPGERLDVNGNVKAQELITTSGIIKNPNGDLCLGSRC